MMEMHAICSPLFAAVVPGYEIGTDTAKIWADANKKIQLRLFCRKLQMFCGLTWNDISRLWRYLDVAFTACMRKNAADRFSTEWRLRCLLRSQCLNGR
jgi:hypothetical protein